MTATTPNRQTLIKWVYDWGYADGIADSICAFPWNSHYLAGFRAGQVARVSDRPPQPES